MAQTRAICRAQSFFFACIRNRAKVAWCRLMLCHFGCAVTGMQKPVCQPVCRYKGNANIPPVKAQYTRS